MAQVASTVYLSSDMSAAGQQYERHPVDAVLEMSESPRPKIAWFRMRCHSKIGSEAGCLYMRSYFSLHIILTQKTFVTGA